MKSGDAVDAAFSKKDAAVVKRVLSVKPKEADVIVSFCGLPRNLTVILRLWNKGYAPRIESLGSNSYPYKKNPEMNAEDYTRVCLKKGVPKELIFTDVKSTTNTRNAAEFEAERMKRKGWARALFVAQGYHMPRAFATFVKTLMDRRLDKKVMVIPQPLRRRDWSAKDRDLQNTWQDELIRQELPRIRKYRKKGDVASFAQVRKYLDFWEMR